MVRQRDEGDEAGLTVLDDQPLFAVTVIENGREITRYFADEAEAEAALPSESIREAMSTAGAWKGADWEEVEAELDRIRHESVPTPPFEL